MSKRGFFIIVAVTVVTAGLVWVLGVSGTRGESAGESQRATRYPIRVVATVGMIGDVVGVVAGERAEVQVLISPGVDPHLYQPTRSDVHAIVGADLVYYVGLQLEGYMSNILDAPHHYSFAEFVTTETLTDGSGKHDPHIWMDVRLWGEAVAGMAESLAAYDPSGAAEYRERAGRYAGQLDGLDAYVRGAVASIPAEKRILVTAHDAFGYFGRAYGIAVEGIQGLSTESEAGLQRINMLVGTLVGREIGAVFVESSVHSKNVQALIEGARSRGHRVGVGGVLFSDAMGPLGEYTGTYIGMLDHNATTIGRALGGARNSGGWQGKLEE